MPILFIRIFDPGCFRTMFDQVVLSETPEAVREKNFEFLSAQVVEI